jgi:hypothetical protein
MICHLFETPNWSKIIGYEPGSSDDVEDDLRKIADDDRRSERRSTIVV